MNVISHEYIRKLILKAVIITILLVACFLAAKALKRQSSVVNAETKRNLKCISVCVTDTDTLWSIASEYYSDEYDSVSDLVSEIKSINRMGSDQINVGNYLIVPYYE